ncbi:MAG: permease-like cell division protein FtsX [Actinomycetota bacterium]
MNFRIGNIFRELSYSLRRNPSLFLGTMAVIAISLIIVGSGLVLGDAVGNATARWKDGVEFAVFMNPDSSQVEIEAVSAKLTANPEIERHSFVDQQNAFIEFQDLFQDSDLIRQSVTVEDMPPSFRVVPSNPESSVVEALADSFRDEPGVFQVVAATDAIRDIEDIGERLNNRFFFVGIFLLAAAMLLVYNTIRTTIFSRRREVEVMRLVGASNWYIRVPFMVEGVLQGLIAGVLTILALPFVNDFIASLGNTQSLALLDGLRATPSQVWSTSILMTIVGAAIGGLASAVALSRYLDV